MLKLTALTLLTFNGSDLLQQLLTLIESDKHVQYNDWDDAILNNDPPVKELN